MLIAYIGDILQKMRVYMFRHIYNGFLIAFQAAGLNAVSFYIHWGLTEGKRGSLNWDYYRSLELFYQVAQRIGIYVVARPGASPIFP
jgi:beta-galactosidase GanA